MKPLAPLLVAAAATVLLSAPAGATPPTPTGVRGHTEVIGDCQHAAQTPRQLVSACGDLNSFAVVKHYDSWTGHQARGSGTYVVNTCRPDCAAGNVVRYPATFSLHRVVTATDGTRLFSRLGITYVRGGEPHDLTLPLPTEPLG